MTPVTEAFDKRSGKYITEKITREWGKNVVDRLGVRLYEALLNEQVLILADTQDASIDSGIVRKQILGDGRLWVIDKVAECQV